MMQNKTIILKIGGSILSPSEDKLFDFEMARKIRDTLTSLDEEYQFICTIGGGQNAKNAQKMVRDEGFTDKEIDLAGISANNHNAMLFRIVLGDLASDNLLTFEEIDTTDEINFTEKFLVVGANKPGRSGDTDAVIMAKRSGADKVFSLKNVDGVYSDDPKKNPEAKKFDEITWQEYRSIIGVDEFKPKMALPVDPVATKMAEETGISFVVLDGRDLENLKKAIQEEEFNGTTIS